MQNPALPARGLTKLLRGRTGALPKDPAAATKRNRILFGAASVLSLAGSYFGIIKPENVRLQETRAAAEQAEAQVAELTSQLAHLRDLERRAPELSDQAARLEEAMPMETHLARFILQVQDASNQAKLEWISASPAPPVPSGAAPGLMESAVTMSGAGRYADIQDFLARIENLQRAVKIGSVNLSQAGESTADPGAKLNMTISLKIFVAPTAPPFPPPETAPAPVAGVDTANAGAPPSGTGQG